MSDLININKIDVDNQEQIENPLKIIIELDLFKEAFLLAKKIEASGKQKEGENWKTILQKLKWIALPKLDEEEIIELFANSFTKIFEIPEYGVWEKLKKKIIFDVIYDERDAFKSKVKGALNKNQEILTSKKLIINNAEISPAVANWLKDYNIHVGLDSASASKQSQYLVNSQNVKNLTEEELKKLKMLIYIYEKLKISSATLQGLEEDLYVEENDQSGILSEGIFIKVDSQKDEELIQKLGAIVLKRTGEENATQAAKDDSLANLDVVQEEYLEEKISKAYVFTMTEQEIIKQEEEDIKRIARGNIILIGKELTKALAQKNRIRTIAALRMAVKNNLLLGWAKKNNKTLVEFLKEILQNRLGLNESEAAKIGVHLCNLLKKLGREVEYVAYFDEEEEKFKWFEHG